MYKLTRRALVERMLLACGAASLPVWTRDAFGQTGYDGKLLVTVQCQGAWDVSSFCDPKANVAGEPEINRWSRSASIGTAGNLRYAPWGSNAKLFQKYSGRMLVINGVDIETNAHETGETVTWSGRTALGYPSLTALFAAIKAPQLALAYVNTGGWGNTEGIINSTRINNALAMRTLLYPNGGNVPGARTFLDSSDVARVRALQQADMAALRANTSTMPQDQLNRAAFEAAMASSESLRAFASLIPEPQKLQQPRSIGANMPQNTVAQQAQMALLAFKSGLSVAADITSFGFDTHADHDRDHEPLLAATLDGIDFLWDYAEELGIADRLVVVMSSDFSRTPYYNAGNGKDHWNISSYVVMEKNAPWTNRMVGLTDGAQNAYKIDASTLQRRDNGGVRLGSRHVHQALRRYLGLEGHSLTALFPFNNTEQVRFFG